MGIGHPGLHRIFLLIRAILIVVLLYPAIYYFGLNGAAVSVMLAMVIAYLFQAIRVRSLTGLHIKGYAENFLLAVLFSTPVAVVWCIVNFLQENYTIRPIILSLILSSLIYLLIVILAIRFSTLRKIIFRRVA
jgi:hypothetical protein